MRSYEEMAERVLARRDAYEKLKIQQLNRRKKTAAVLIPTALSLCIAVGIALGLLLQGESGSPHNTIPNTTDSEGRLLWADDRSYNKKTAALSELGYYIWPWEYRTPTERFPAVSYEGTDYITRSQKIAPEFLGDRLGIGSAVGYDDYTEQSYTTECTVYAIKGISESCLVAVEYPDSDTFYVFRGEEKPQSVTLGDLMDAYGLSETLPLTRFTVYENERSGTGTHYALTESDSDKLWSLLDQCRNAPCAGQFSSVSRGERVTFTAKSEQLGITNKAFSIGADGYLKTNLAEYGYSYYIGEDVAREIIDYAKKHGTETEPAPQYHLIGTVTEVGADYVKVDDSVMMKNPKDGITFTVLLKELRLTRYIESGRICVGSTVRIEYDGRIYADSPSVIEMPYTIESVIIAESGDVWIPE